jgi:hypothetical protein
MKSITYAALIFGILSCSCTQDSSNGIGPRADSAPKPLVWIQLESPKYMEANVSQDTTIGFQLVTYDYRRLTIDQARDEIVKGVVIESYPTQTALKGSWTQTASSMIFTPASSLPKGDYVIRFPKASSDFKVTPRPYNVFRVGSGPLRLAEIDLLLDKSSTSKDLVQIQFQYSEAVSSSFKSTCAVTQDSSSISFSTLTNTTAMLASAIDPSKSVSISVSSKDLDGIWTGVAGSGAVAVDFIPKDYQIEPGEVLYYVPPSLSIELPSGVKK